LVNLDQAILQLALPAQLEIIKDSTGNVFSSDGCKKQLLHHQCEWEFRAPLQLGAAGHIAKSPDLLEGRRNYPVQEREVLLGRRASHKVFLDWFQCLFLSERLRRLTKAEPRLFQGPVLDVSAAGQNLRQASLVRGLQASLQLTTRWCATPLRTLCFCRLFSKATTQQATGLHKQVTFLHKNLALLTPFMCAL